MNLKLTVARAMTVFGLVVLSGCIAILWTSSTALTELKVGGPVYKQIVQGKDLIADILPPPEYVIEAYLEATLAVKEPESLAEHEQRLEQLRKDYDLRHEYWQAEDFRTDIKDDLVNKSHVEVAAFWEELDGGLLPAIRKADAATIDESYGKLKQHYLAHRAIIDRIVAATNDFNAATEKSAAATDGRFALIVWSVAGIVILVVVGGILAIRGGVVKPIQRMTGAMTTISEGKLDIDIPSAGRRDEIGAMANALDVFRRNAQETLRLRAAQEEASAAAEKEKLQALQTMADTVEKETGDAVSTISSLTSQMATNASQMAASAGSVSNNSQSVSAAATQALANAQTVAAAAEELSASIVEIASQVSNSRTVTQGAVSASSVAEATISELSQAVDKIGDVTKLISEIASQTNLLALNATIEAARAGEAGKGFAVVAHEVKSLANQTATATGDISQQIAAVREVTERAVKSVQEIANSIRGVEAASTAIAAAIEEQTATTTEISRNVTETTVASQEVADRINGVSSEAIATGERAGEVNSLCANVASGIDTLREILVRVVRTSTKEVDRRRKLRYGVNWDAVVRAEGRSYDATVENGSTGGLMMVMKDLVPTSVQRVEVMIAGFPESLPANVRANARERLHVKFDLPSGIKERYEAQFKSRVAGKQPLPSAA